jgi:molybdopterin-guanine dinucleotide biosynthesis protein A
MISIHIQNITGIIIAGEKLQLAKNKSFIHIKEEISLRTLHNLLKLFCSEILVSSHCPAEYHFLNERVVTDKIEGLGPIGSILSCLSESASKKNLIISCDMPMIPAGLIHQLIQKKDIADFVAPTTGMEIIEPYCAIYDKRIISVITRMISMGDYNLNHLPYYCNSELIQVYNGNNIFKEKTSNILRKG